MFKGVTFTEVWQKLLQSVFQRSDSTLPSWTVLLKRKYWELKDRELGREHIGVDRYGNEYYQHYSYFGGLPTRRIVLYKHYEYNNFHNDPHFNAWVHYRIDKAPTAEELQLLYLEDDQRKRRAIAWDLQQEQLIQESKQKTQEVTDKIKAETLETSETNSKNLLNDDKGYQYVEDNKNKPLIEATNEESIEEAKTNLRILREIIREKEIKIEAYKEKKADREKYLENAVKKFNRHDKFREKFKDVFLEIDLGKAKENYAMIEKDPDIVYTLKNL